MKTLHHTRGFAQDLTVTSEGGTITLWSAARTRHTVYDSAAPHLPGLEYARNMLATLAFCPQAQSCLILGLGGGSIPRMLLAARPQIEVEAVELDPDVMELAARYFNIHALPRFTIRMGDAASFLRQCTSRYGIVVVDTYIGEKFPDHCTTPEFIQDARKCMLEAGILAVNWLSDDRQTQKTLIRNLESIIGPVWQLPGLKSRNLVYFVPAQPLSHKEVISAAAAVEAEIPFENSLKRIARRLRNSS
jgi:spermidine synthase